MNPLLSNPANLVDFIIEWNNKFPFDYFWRKKHGVAFGTAAHLDMNFIDMKIDLLEEKVYANFAKQIRKGKDKEAGTRLLKRQKVKYDNNFTDDDFDSLDISKFK
jgi:hypothetical protein